MSFTGIIASLAKPVLGPLFGIIDKAVTDKDEANKLKFELEKGVQEFGASLLKSQTEIILAEANSQSWLPRNIRPLFLLFLLISMVASVFMGALGYGEPLAVGWASIPGPAWSLMQIGLGGYIAGRTVEKVSGGAIGNAVKNVIPRWQRDEDYKK